MLNAHDFLQAQAVVMCTAAVTTVLSQRLKQPVVLGYVVAGLIIGPHVPIPLVADPEIVHILSEQGVILLMFALGLEFSLHKLIRVGPTAGVAAVVQCSVMIWLGFVTGRAFGWTTMECIFAGAIIAISSTTIIVKAFADQGIRGKLQELVVGILIVEDLIGIMLMTLLTALSTTGDLSAGTLLGTAGRLGLFLVGLLGLGMLVVPRLVRAVIRINRPETTLVFSLGVCFAVALLAHQFGYSVALGAFIAGSLIAESGEEKVVEHLVQPVRDMFAAIFFVSVGMMMDPALLVEHAGAIAVFTVVVIVGKIVSVSLGAFLAGHGTRTSVQAGMSLAQIGEFSFIIAGLGLSLGTTREFLYPIAVAVSVVTTLTTPWLIRASGAVANVVDRKLPKSLQTFASLYASWLERLRHAPDQRTARAQIRRMLKLLVLDAVLLIGVVVGASVELDALGALLQSATGVSQRVAQALIVLGAVLLATPFCVGIVRMARKLGTVLALAALPQAAAGMVDTAAAPRRTFIVVLQLAVVLAVGLPVAAVTQPFIGYPSTLLLVLVVSALGLVFWRSAMNLHGHVRAGAQMIVESLAAQSHVTGDGHDQAMAAVHKALPGIGEPTAVHLSSSSPAVGKTLAELNLRGVTGASVLVIVRKGAGTLVPTAREVLQLDDVLALAGTRDAIATARTMLETGGH